MKKNMGITDKIIRITIAVIVAVLIFFEIITGTFAFISGIIAGVFLLTSFISFCPMYALFGLNTCSTKA